MACLVNDFASFDTPEDPGGASIVERKDFQAKRPLCNTYEVTSYNYLTLIDMFQGCPKQGGRRCCYTKRKDNFELS